MTHLELENLISEYLEGQLDAAHRAEFEAHAAECTPCHELVAGVRRAVELCQSAEELDPAPWLISKIMLSTVGQRKPTFREQLAAYFRPAARVRLAYAVAMAVFSFSIIVNTAGINLRQISLADLDPRNWLYQADRTMNLAFGRAEKFYYDLRVVYEIESRLRQFRQQSGQESRPQEKTSPKPENPAGGTTDTTLPGNPELAEARDFFIGTSDLSGSGTLLVRLTRSSLR
jgi:putative zinc finger protein